MSQFKYLKKYLLSILGHLRARLQFSEAIPSDLTLIVIGEFNSVLELNHNGTVTTSYTSK